MRGSSVVHAAGTDRRLGLSRSATDQELLSAWRRRVGDPATVSSLLDDLDRRATPARLRVTRAVSAFRWEQADASTSRWVPQGVTTSADAHPAETVDGRDVVAVSWYRRNRFMPDLASRVTFADVTDAARPRYRHVLLVEPAWEPGSALTHPVPVHAGGVVWYGDLLYVTSTYTGLRVFHLDDLVRVDPAEHGYGYLLPQRWAYRPTGDPAAPMRYSFASVDRSTHPHSLLAGEYGRGDSATRIIRFALDETGHLAGGAAVAEPTDAFGLDVLSMQGVACVDATYYVSASNGRRGRGHLWVGDPTRGFRCRRWVLPAGPEDVSLRPSRGLLWSVTEWPGRRVVFALRVGDAPGRTW